MKTTNESMKELRKGMWKNSQNRRTTIQCQNCDHRIQKWAEQTTHQKTPSTICPHCGSINKWQYPTTNTKINAHKLIKYIEQQMEEQE